MDGTETNWDIENHNKRSYFIYKWAKKIVEERRLHCSRKRSTLTGYHSEVGHVQESYSGSILVGSGGGGGFQS
jgi:hypothetical protein